MKLLLIGGFLGAGKTTVIRSILTGIDEAGQSAAIIENEIGELGIDDRLLSGGKVQVTPLFGGCVCCQISGDLLNAVDQIRAELAPDWLIVEATGLAFLSELRKLFEDFDAPVCSVAVVDITRWARLYRANPELMRSQLEGAEAVIVNKTDVKEPESAELVQLRALAGGDAALIPSSPEDKSTGALWEALRRSFGG